jgi:hypothetical protein
LHLTEPGTLFCQSKSFVPDYGDLPQIDLIDTDEKKHLMNEIICEHFLRRGYIDAANSLVDVSDLVVLPVFENDQKAHSLFFIGNPPEFRSG